MRVKLTTVIRWRGCERAGQPADGYEVPDDDDTRLAIRKGWLVEVEPKPSAKAGTKGGDAS